MRYVILRDDDTNALTPVECLERLYRPFLERGLPVNLAVIPKVRTDVRGGDGRPEGYLPTDTPLRGDALPIGSNGKLVRYLLQNPGFHIVQHGYHHTFNEFEGRDPADILYRLKEGARLLKEAGFAKPQTFVAPYDKFSRVSLGEAARVFRVVSTGWFELRRVPFWWWPWYAFKRLLKKPHWRVGGTALLSHPGCLLSSRCPPHTILESVAQTIASRRLTVLVTHWWEYFRAGAADERFIEVLHGTARYLAGDPNIAVVSFDDVAGGKVTINGR
jgi:hypothetical protein